MPSRGAPGHAWRGEPGGVEATRFRFSHERALNIGQVTSASLDLARLTLLRGDDV